jgi:hypothetical protein
MNRYQQQLQYYRCTVNDGYEYEFSACTVPMESMHWYQLMPFSDDKMAAVVSTDDNTDAKVIFFERNEEDSTAVLASYDTLVDMSHPNGVISEHAYHWIIMEDGAYYLNTVLADDLHTKYVNDLSAGFDGLNKRLLVVGDTLIVASDLGISLYRIDMPSSIHDAEQATGLPQLSNYPNPFNPETTTIRYTVPKDGDVRLCIYNTRGQLITTLVNEHKNLGIHSVVWNGLDDNGNKVSSGLYFTRIVTDGKTLTAKMLMLK